MLTEKEKTLVEAAIAQAERTTSGEIVAVVADASGTYHYVPFLWASVVALAVPWPLIHWTWMPVQDIYLIQLAIFGLFAATLQYRPLRLRLVPPSTKRENAHRRAVEQFMAQNISTMPGHTGVLLFVSAAERYVEVLAEEAVHREVAETEWQDIVSALTAAIAAGRAAPGLATAASAIGTHLAAHFPPKDGPRNVLPNHLILLTAG